MDVFIGRSARVGEPTRLQYQRKRVSGWMQAAVRPYIDWWMGKERTTRLRGLRITVPVGVFPPKFFLSTKLLVITCGGLLSGRQMRSPAPVQMARPSAQVRRPWVMPGQQSLV